MNFSKVVYTLFLVLIITSIFLTSCSTVGNLPLSQESFTSMSSFLEEKDYPSFNTTLPDFYYRGTDWNKKSLELIEQATESILIATFLGVLDDSTKEIWDALKRKADSGVKVYLAIDAASNFQAIPETDDYVQSAFIYLKELGLNYVEYNSMSLSNIFYLFSLLDRDHRKYWVFDQELVAVGGININHTSINYPVGVGHTDIMGLISSPGLANHLTEIFVENYNRYAAKEISLADFPSKEKTLESKDFNHTAYVLDHNIKKGGAVKDLFNAFALVSEDELWMVQGYTFLSPSLIKRIQYIVDKGVKVNFILSTNSTQEKYEKASYYSMVDLIEAGATVYLYDSPEKAFLHQKVAIADGRYSTFGSTNYNFRSHTVNRELNLIYDDEEIASTLMNFIDSLVKDSTKVDLEEAKQYRSFSYYLTNLIMQVWG